MQLLGGLSAQQFLREYWQKKPLLIRQAIPGFVSPVSAEELAGFACEEDVESRMIFEHAGKTPWELVHGPFSESDFAALPESHWTLLVQSANQFIPELAEFLQKFDFIPGWRIDDIMISYAADQGSVGPHLDQYDVFLLQGLGQRRWQINTKDFSEATLIENSGLKILEHFEAEEEWVLQPGDMLYLPPNVAHYGVALNDCITYSIGFRAPSVAELLGSYVDDYVMSLSDAERYTDDDLVVQQHSGEITPAALEKIAKLLKAALNQPEYIAHWFGKYITETNRTERFSTEHPLDKSAFLARLQAEDVIYRSEHSRFAYIDMGESISLFVDGHEFNLARQVLTTVQQVCDRRVIPVDAIVSEMQYPQALALLTELYNRSVIWFESDENEID